MARTFIPTYTDKRTGKRRKSPNCHVAFDDHMGTTRRVVAFPVKAGKARSEGLATRLDRLAACRATGDPWPIELRQFIDNMKPELLAKLVGWGIIDAPAGHRQKPMAYHLIGYYHHLKAKGDELRHVRQEVRKIGHAVRQCNMHYLNDLTALAMDKYLASRRAGNLRMRKKGRIARMKQLSASTSNKHLTAIGGFCNWLVKLGRLSRSPLCDLEPLKVIEEETRWPLSVAEMQELMDTSAGGPTLDDGTRAGPIMRWGMTGNERALLYRLAVEIGYRASELGSLTRASFDLESDTPTVRLLAGSSKGRRRSSIPLRPETVSMLRNHLASKAPAARAFHMPTSTHTAEMIRADLIDAKIAVSDALGRKRDFHALRHTCGTWLGNAGVHPKVIQTIMRHSTVRLTMDRYVHADRDQVTAALGQLPTLDDPQREAASATGTDSACATLAQKREQTHPNEDKGGQSDRKPSTRLSTDVLKKKPGKTEQWGRLDSNQRRHKPADLQSAPFGHFGTPPPRTSTQEAIVSWRARHDVTPRRDSKQIDCMTDTRTNRYTANRRPCIAQRLPI